MVIRKSKAFGIKRMGITSLLCISKISFIVVASYWKSLKSWKTLFCIFMNIAVVLLSIYGSTARVDVGIGTTNSVVHSHALTIFLVDPNRRLNPEYIEHRSSPLKYGFSPSLLMWILDQAYNMIFCTWDYCNTSILYLQ